MWNVLCTRKGKFTFAGKYLVNLNLFRAEQRKNVPKNRNRDKKNISGEYLHASVILPPNLKKITLNISNLFENDNFQKKRKVEKSTHALHWERESASHSMCSEEKTVPSIVALYLFRAMICLAGTSLMFENIPRPSAGALHRHGSSCVMSWSRSNPMWIL